jgi:hypothetical protein
MAVEDITSATQAVATGGFAPLSSALATYVTPNVLRSLLVDRDGSLVSRSTVLTDEGSWRESFNAPLGVDWQQNAGGGSLVQAGSTLTITGSLVPGAAGYIARTVDYAPILLSVCLGTGGVSPATVLAPVVVRGGGGGAGAGETFFGLYALDLVANPTLDPSHPTAQASFAEWLFTPNPALTTQGILVTRSSASSPAGTEGTAPVTISTTLGAGWRTISLGQQSAIFRDGSTTLPTATVRATRSRELPAPYAPMFFAAGFRAGAFPAAPAPVLALDTVLVQSIDRINTDASF